SLAVGGLDRSAGPSSAAAGAAQRTRFEDHESGDAVGSAGFWNHVRNRAAAVFCPGRKGLHQRILPGENAGADSSGNQCSDISVEILSGYGGMGSLRIGAAGRAGDCDCIARLLDDCDRVRQIDGLRTVDGKRNMSLQDLWRMSYDSHTIDILRNSK